MVSSTEWDCTGTIQHCLERDNHDNGFARRVPPPTTLFLHVRALVLTHVCMLPLGYLNQTALWQVVLSIHGKLKEDTSPLSPQLVLEQISRGGSWTVAASRLSTPAPPLLSPFSLTRDYMECACASEPEAPQP